MSFKPFADANMLQGSTPTSSLSIDRDYVGIIENLRRKASQRHACYGVLAFARLRLKNELEK